MAEHASDPTGSAGATVRLLVDGVQVLCLEPSDTDRYPTETREVSFECSSGDVITGTWRGIPLVSVLRACSLPDETTHVLITARDGHRCCLAVGQAFDALLAYERVDGPSDSDGIPRLLVPGIAGPRTLKWVTTIEPMALDPGEDPQEYEPLPPSIARD